MRAIPESDCYWAGTGAPARNSAPQYRSPLARHNDKSPWPKWLRRDSAGEIEPFRLPAAPLHAEHRLVAESLCHSRATQRMTTAPNSARTSDLTQPLL